MQPACEVVLAVRFPALHRRENIGPKKGSIEFFDLLRANHQERWRWRWRWRRNPPVAAGAVPVVVAINNIVVDAAVTRQVGAGIAIVQPTDGKHQATRTASPAILKAHRRHGPAFRPRNRVPKNPYQRAKSCSDYQQAKDVDSVMLGSAAAEAPRGCRQGSGFSVHRVNVWKRTTPSCIKTVRRVAVAPSIFIILVLRRPSPML